MKNLRVATRLSLAFGLISVIFGAALAIGIYRLTGFKNAVHVLTDERIHKLETTDDWTFALQETARHMDNMLILDDQDKIKKELDAVAEDRAKRTKFREALAAAAVTADEKSALAAVVEARAAHVPYETEYLNLIEAGSFKQAKAVLLEHARPTQLAYLDKLRSFRDFQAVQIKANAEALSDSYRSSVTQLVALLVVALGVAGVFAALITRSLTVPLKRVIGHFDALRNGRFDEKIEVHSTEETGQLLSALKIMQDALRQNEIGAANAKGQIAAIDRSQALIEFDPNGTIRKANENFLRAVGYTLADIQGKHHRLFVDPAERETADYRAFWEKLARGEPAAGRFKRRAADGRDIWLQATYNPILSVDGSVYKIVKLAADVTAQVQLEEERQRMQNEQVEAKQALDQAVAETQAVVQAAIQGELTQRIALHGKTGQIGALAGSVNTLIESMMTVVAEIKRAAGEVQSGAHEISSGNVNLSQRTEEQASSLEQTASSMDEMTSTVKSTADNAAQASQLALAARDQAERGGAIVSSAVTAMSGINEASKKISDIIGVIDEIAFQTNLLALNAAVEAARAGDHGKGFAVVASEVRSLAGRSASAAKEIKALIGDTVSRVEEGSRLVGESGRALGDIGTAVKRVSDVVAEIATASQEQASGIAQVNKAIMQMDDSTQQNAALVEEAAAASESIVGQAGNLAALVARYEVSESVAAPQVERRGAKRPWSTATRAAAAAAPAAAEAAPAQTLLG